MYTYEVTCTCDENCDSPCPVHRREIELENRLLELSDIRTKEDIELVLYEFMLLGNGEYVSGIIDAFQFILGDVELEELRQKAND